MSRFVLAGIALCMMATGCGGDGKYVPVSGTITYNGSPLKGAMVSFQPVAKSGMDAGGVGSTGRTDDNGRYTLDASTPQPTPGALVGKHTVRISLVPSGTAPANDNMDAGNVMSKKGGASIATQPIPAKYNDETTLTFDVVSGGTDKADFKLEGPPLPVRK